ncbi:cytosine deaminase [Pseudanabaena sp. PCC 6802]|uniref:cytosine deaminase n=1 Tax=Pseudanabaena sp. PCC 6802 TaxID=118173 RepID=UPI0003484DA5|nr:cytosine deaminase [Pseudanabaena sp. PCC 6802]
MLHAIASPHYWLTNCHIPTCLLDREFNVNASWEGIAAFDLEILDGKIHTVIPTNSAHRTSSHIEQIDLRQGMVLPCFIDMHTHLDKGHIWNRTPNLDGTFVNALQVVEVDRDRYWNSEDLYRRMEFGLKCSYAHGTKAIRTHLDCPFPQADISLDVFKALHQTWADRLTLQAVSLVTLDRFMGTEGKALADRIADLGAVLGGVAFLNPDIDIQLDRVFSLAKERQLDLDFHTDENDNPQSDTLLRVARAALRHEFTGRITCGHCCSLTVQDAIAVQETIALVKEAGIGIVSLPTCNLYLQDRKAGITPRWRGVTLMQELKAMGVEVAIAQDNCRDPFYSFGDGDLLQVFAMSVQIAHLDSPYGNWLQTITSTPARLMGLENTGKIGVGQPADLVICKARNFSELLSRPQSDRRIIRSGQLVDSTLPDYSELDDLIFREGV